MEKIALITGGTSGIGLECAKKFLVNKINVILVGRNKDKYIEARKYLKSFITKDVFCDFIQADISSAKNCKSVIDTVIEKYKKLNIVVNNAGIYLENAIEDVEAALKGMLEPIYEEKVIGQVEIRQIFKASGVGNIAGSYVLDGYMERGCKVRISREGKQIFEGDLASLKRFKDDVKEVKTGYECGLVFDGFNDIAEFDVVEAYKMVEVPR